jgi:hypothetical protein
MREITTNQLIPFLSLSEVGLSKLEIGYHLIVLLKLKNMDDSKRVFLAIVSIIFALFLLI